MDANVARRFGASSTSKETDVMDRRKVLSTGSAAAVAALAGCATGGTGSPTGGGKTVFAVAQPMLPIVGTSEMFPVRRIYCIGRNYAAHAREMG